MDTMKVASYSLFSKQVNWWQGDGFADSMWLEHTELLITKR